MVEANNAAIAVIAAQAIRDKIYEVRGVKVMLDFELAEIYGYETKNFNRQVKNNAAKFAGDEFMFVLTKDEVEKISRCKNFTSIQTKGVKGGRSKRIFHCGASSKDAGVHRITVISEMTEPLRKSAFHDVIVKLLSNPSLRLK